ncbi:GntR family transcriptional regulator [Kocuria carniphila]|uniref:GntR family transcriptional regulator n=1 Tax=Kocuria carniphila TaxID=262208 RepID=A0ABV3V5N3_9MICC|nr:GntR family transcriptional regulator [Kocuria carniphila]
MTELKHELVRRQLRDLAQQGLRPGDSLPGERSLEKQFEVSRITIRRAISDLVGEGVLVRVKGKGTFVSHGRVRSDLHLASFHEDMRAAGFTPSTRVVTAQLELPPDDAAAHLALGPQDPAILVRRLRLANNAPVSVDECWMPPSLVPDLLAQDLKQSLYGHLAAAGHPVLRVEQTVEAAAASEPIAELLDITVGSPVLLFHRRSFTGGDQTIPIEYSISTYRSDRYQLSMRLAQDRAASSTAT